MTDYGAKFDKTVAVAMFALIILSIVGVVALQISAHTDCRHAEYTYCDPDNHH
jgi:hypothetical protein